MRKLGYVDAIRGVAILGVMMVHCDHYGSNNYPVTLKWVFENGARGVQLFYVASAFTLFLSMSKRRNNEVSPNINFFMRRFFRIAPMYYIAIAYYLFQDGFGPRYFLGDAPGITSMNVLSNVLFIHGINPYWITSVVPGGWSITVEMMFYCLVPFLFLKIKSLNRAIVFLIISTILSFCLHGLLQNRHFISDSELWNNFLFLYLPSQLPAFACGIILFFLVTTPKMEWHVDPFVVLILSIIILIQLSTGLVFIASHIQFALTFIILSFALSRRSFKILVNPIVIYIGKISYSIYLVHFAVLHWLARFNLIDIIPKDIKYFNLLNYCARFLCVLVLTVGIATLFYRFIEIPFMRLGKLIIKRRENVHLLILNENLG